jgi:hypothetical protein
MADPILGEQQFIPNQLSTDYRARFHRDPSIGVMSVQYSTDAGLSWKQFISQPPSIATEGWIPALSPNGDVTWKPIASLISSFLSSSTSSTTGSGGNTSAKLNWADFSLPGTVSTDREFGYFSVPTSLRVSCYGVQASIFSPTVTGPITIGIMVNTEINARQTIVLPNNTTTINTIFDSPLSLSSEQTIKLKIISCPESEGEFLVCRLLFNY